jgi:hypothetical protein
MNFCMAVLKRNRATVPPPPADINRISFIGRSTVISL